LEDCWRKAAGENTIEMIRRRRKKKKKTKKKTKKKNEEEEKKKKKKERKKERRRRRSWEKLSRKYPLPSYTALSLPLVSLLFLSSCSKQHCSHANIL